MRVRLRILLPTAFTIGFGFIVLFGLLVSDGMGLISNLAQTFALREITTSIILPVTTVTLGLILLIGVLNLLVVHFDRVIRRKKGFAYSVLLLGSYLLIILAYLLDSTEVINLLLEDVLVPIESALAGLLLFSLVYGAATVTFRRKSFGGVLFVVVMVIVLIGAIPISQTEVVAQVKDWLLTVPVNAGAQGILLGIALATLVAGVRVLIGQDRSYRE